MRTYKYHPGPCACCRRVPSNGALWVTDAQPFDWERLGIPGGGIAEANPGEPKLCDPCDWQRRVRDPAVRRMVGIA